MDYIIGIGISILTTAKFVDFITAILEVI